MTIDAQLPDYTSQNATEYKNAIDGSVAINAEVGRQFYVTQSATPAMSVLVNSGKNQNGEPIAPVDLTIPVADQLDNRIDLVQITPEGVAEVKEGTPSATPVTPSLDTGKIALASVLVIANASEIASASITDLRSIIAGGTGGGAGTRVFEFTDADLTAGTITITHDLGTTSITHALYNDDDEGGSPATIKILSTTELELTFSAALIGTYTLVLQGGAIDDEGIVEFLNQVEVTPSGDDEGVRFLNQVEVIGELISGADSYPVPIAYHCDIATTSGTVITGAVDVTNILKSDASSSIGLFGGETAGKYLLVGSPTATFEGAKVKYDTLGTVEPDNIAGEFYENAVNEWREVPFMGTNSEYPFEEHGDKISISDSEQIFFGFNPLTRMEPETWELIEFTINGQPITMYWARLRITSNITLDPIAEQVKLHTDRIEHEAFGHFRFGKGRRPVTLTAGIEGSIPNALLSIPNQTVAYTPTFTAGFENNRLRHNQDDGFGIVVNRAWGLDTSVPIQLDISYYVAGTSTGLAEFTVNSSQVVDGYVYNGANPSTTHTVTDDITVSQNLIRRTVSLEIPINKLESNSGILLEIARYGATSGVDTLSSDVVVTNVVATGYVWKD